MGNICMKILSILTSGSGGDVIYCFLSVLAEAAFFSVRRYHFCNFERRHYENIYVLF